MEAFIEHKPGDQYIINTHALHNAHLIRSLLPRHLTVPIPLFEDREKKHHELAAELHAIKYGRRKAAQEKRDAKKASEMAAVQSSGSGTSTKKRKTAHC